MRRKYGARKKAGTIRESKYKRRAKSNIST
jgi:hypothetical protein